VNVLAYWLEIAMFSYDLATTWWPIPTIILAVLVILVKASQDNWKSLDEWAKSVGIALAIFMVGLVFFYAPYAHNAKLKDTFAKDGEKIANLEAANKELTSANASLAGEKKELEQSVNSLRAQAEHIESDKQQKAAFIKKLCFHENLHFWETPAAPPSPYDGNRGYAKQVKVWPRFGSSETVIIRINADAVFQLYEKYPEAPEVVTLSGNGPIPSGGYFHEFKLRRGAIKNSPTTITLVNSTSFNVICIDRIPSL
jgi:hypothetical protein